MDRSEKVGIAFLAVFSLPFSIFGLAAVFKGIRMLAEGQSGGPWMLVLFGIVFSTIGVGLMLGAIFGPRKMQQAQRRRAENPDQPWLWRDDWTQGRANSQTKPEMIRAWIIATLWNVVSTPPLFFISQEQVQKNPASLLGLLFPLVGVGLLVWAVRETLRWFEFGKTCFQMATVPCVIGREVRGEIQTRFPRPPSHAIRLKLTCVRHVVTNSANRQTAQDIILWREEKTVSPEELIAGPMGTNIPVSFHIPLDVQQTDSANPNNSILWQLEAIADVPGVDYDDTFELPVFRTKDTPSTEQESAFASDRASAAFTPTILVRNTPEGNTEFYFPAARNPGFASGLALFSVIWSGLLWFMIAKRAPFIFPLVWSFFDLLLIYGSLQMWLGTSSVVVGSGTVRVRSGLLGSGKTREIAFGQVDRIQTAITAQQGGASGTPYYDIQLFQTDGTKITLGSTVRSKQEAEWLASEIQRLITPKAHSATAGTF
jgi:hypothetical protein